MVPLRLGGMRGLTYNEYRIKTCVFIIEKTSQFTLTKIIVDFFSRRESRPWSLVLSRNTNIFYYGGWGGGRKI
jgi:hypothetical protein